MKTYTLHEMLQEYVVDLKHLLDLLPFEQLTNLVDRLHTARVAGKQIFVLGNGGSASTATHLACDLGKNTVTANLPRFRVLALTDNMAAFSAIANDLGYENVFAEQLANFIDADDLVIAISASGNSPNVLKAVNLAREHMAFTIGWSGFDGGKLAGLVDLPIIVRSHSMEQIEDLHLMLAHMVTVSARHAGEQAGKASASRPLPALSSANGLESTPGKPRLKQQPLPVA
jgi:D-sedoheptulose 7-phosphate isomerase